MFNFFKRKSRGLSINQINSFNDKELDFAIFDDINEKIEKGSREIISYGREACYATWILEAEVMNGGFNQFYFNKSPELMNIAIEGFNRFGAIKYEKLARKVAAVFESIKDEWKRLNDGTMESFSKSYKDNPLNNLDKEFYDLENEQTLESIRAQYIRKHVQEFT